MWKSSLLLVFLCSFHSALSEEKLVQCQNVAYDSNNIATIWCACERWDIATAAYTQTYKACKDDHYCQKVEVTDQPYTDYRCVHYQTYQWQKDWYDGKESEEKLVQCQNARYDEADIPTEWCACEKWDITTAAYTRTYKACKDGHYCEKLQFTDAPYTDYRCISYQTSEVQDDWQAAKMCEEKVVQCQNVRYDVTNFPVVWCACERWDIATAAYTQTYKACKDDHYCQKVEVTDQPYTDYRCVHHDTNELQEDW